MTKVTLVPSAIRKDVQRPTRGEQLQIHSIFGRALRLETIYLRQGFCKLQSWFVTLPAWTSSVRRQLIQPDFRIRIATLE